MTSLEILPHKSRALARHPHPPRPSLIWMVDLPRAVGSAVGSAVVGYYVEMGLDAMHEALAEEAEEEEEEEPEAKRQ